MKKITYIQEYSIRGGQDEKAGTETKCSRIMVNGDNPEQELWDKVLGEISGGYEQRLFVNDDEFDCVGSDEAVAELRKEGMEAFKKEHGIDKIKAMGYYDDAWSGYMSDQTFYRIKTSTPKTKPEPLKLVNELVEQVDKITAEGIKELAHYAETLEDTSDTANCFGKVLDAVKNFAKRYGALKPKFYTICGFNYESCDDAYPIKNGKIYNTPEEAYPDVVKLANDVISNFDNGFDDTPKPITEADCTPEGYELNADKFHLHIIIQEHSSK